MKKLYLYLNEENGIKNNLLHDTDAELLFFVLSHYVFLYLRVFSFKKKKKSIILKTFSCIIENIFLYRKMEPFYKEKKKKRMEIFVENHTRNLLYTLKGYKYDIAHIL